jgi:hypothetical protein
MSHTAEVQTARAATALAAAWLTEWECGGDPVARGKLFDTVRTIAAQLNGFVQGDGLYDLATGKFAVGAAKVSVSHLSAPALGDSSMSCGSSGKASVTAWRSGRRWSV